MRLEVDLSNRTALLKAEREYQTALDMIKLALKNQESTPGAGGISESKKEEDSILFNALPSEFSRLTLMEQGITRDRARKLVEKWVGSSRIKELRKGSGSNPSIFVKA